MYEGAVQNLIDELGRLPGVGPKSAQRIAFYILNSDASDMARLTTAISTVKSSVSFCETCGNVSETKQCVICRDDRRDPAVIAWLRSPRMWWQLSAPVPLPGATMCWAGLLTRWRGLAPSSCVSRAGFAPGG